MSFAEEIEKLSELKKSGAMSEDEFQEAKSRLLSTLPHPTHPISKSEGSTPIDENVWSMFLHLSQLCGYFVPLAGLIVPIILWQIKKDESEIIDQHGRIVVNWVISEVIYFFIFGLLCFVIIGIPLIMILMVLSIVYPIVGAVKANNGEAWSYPGAIRFFK